MNNGFSISALAKVAISTLLCALIVACGGGGGDADPNARCRGFGDTDPDCVDGAIPIPPLGYSIDLGLEDAMGNSTNVIPPTGRVTLRVEVTEDDNAGAAVDDVIVEVATDSDISISDGGRGLLDSTGTALFDIEAGDARGAGEITVSVESPAGTNTESIRFEILAQQDDIRLGSFDGAVFEQGVIGLNADTLTPGGEALLTLAVVDPSDTRIDYTADIELTSDCANAGTASLPTRVEAIEGLAFAIYEDFGCDGMDTIRASLVDSSEVATARLEIAGASANTVSYIDRNPANGFISLKGTGSADRPEEGLVRFQVSRGSDDPDVPGEPIEGELVEFSLSSTVGGIELLTTSDISDESGFVSARVRSGNIATSVRITARLNASDGQGVTLSVATISDPLVVSTGLPDQNSISLSTSEFVLEGAAEYDGVTASITVRLADKFNNTVADGTVATFQTEYGAIDSSCSTTNGACSVEWRSQSPRLPTFNRDIVRTIFDDDYDCPSHNASFGPCPDSLGELHGLRSTILVTVLGEEFFVDENGNGLYDEGEPFENLPEAFLDSNEDGVFTPEDATQCDVADAERCELSGSEETFVDYNGDSMYSDGSEPEVGVGGWYNGSLCPEDGDGVYCSRELVHVRDSLRLILGSESAFTSIMIDQSGTDVAGPSEGRQQIIYISDRFNNQPPAGSTVTIETVGDCELATESNFEVNDRAGYGAFGVPLLVEGDGGSGTVVVKVSTSGGEYSQSYQCFTTAPPPETAMVPNDPGGLTTGG